MPWCRAQPPRPGAAPPPPACLLAALTLARDEDAMQHRLRKVLSSYTFSSSALQALDDQPDEEQHLREGAYSDQPHRQHEPRPAAAGEAAAMQHTQHEAAQRGQQHGGRGTRNGFGTGGGSIA